MDQTQFGPDAARALAAKADQIRMSGTVLTSFSEQEPHLAFECGVEMAAFEARGLLGSGAVDRVVAQALQGERTRRPFMVSDQDMKAIVRLEGVVSLAASRIAQKYMALEAENKQSSQVQLGSVISLVTGAAALYKTFF